MRQNATSTPTDANLVTSDITTNNASTSKHGFTPKLSNTAYDFLSGLGTFIQPIDYSRRVYNLLGGSILAEPPGFTVNNIVTNFSLVDGTAYYIAVYLPQAATITGVRFNMVTQGSFTADNNNVVGLYTYSGGNLTQVAVSANDANLWKATSNTWSNKAFTGTFPATAGLYFIGILYNSSAQTTAPALAAITTSNTTAGSVDFTNSAKLRGSITGQTNLANPTQAMSGLVATGANPYVALY